jgi:acetyl-CoA/propionyl-CoA carboxylase biotin carboxyl carrier protein
VDFLPSVGRVLELRDAAGPGVRVDSGLAPGTQVGTAYDPLLAKVIAHGPDRATALRRLRAALADTVVLGVDTNTGFLRRLLAHPAVVAGDLDTGLIDRDAVLLPSGVPDEVYAAAALLRQHGLQPRPGPNAWTDPFSVPSGWRLGGEPAWTVHHLKVPGRDPVIVRVGDGRVRIGDGPAIEARLTLDGTHALLQREDTVTAFRHAGEWLGRDGDSWRVQVHDPVAAALRRAAAGAGGDTLTAPMPGTVTVVKVAKGDEVTAGQSLLVVEAMKMEHVITSPHDGTVTEIDVSVGAAVAMDQILAVVIAADATGGEPDGLDSPAGAAGTAASGTTDATSAITSER